MTVPSAIPSIDDEYLSDFLIHIQTACIGRSEDGLTTNIHARCDALGNPTSFHLTPGQAHDLEGADALLPDIVTTIQAFLADKA